MTIRRFLLPGVLCAAVFVSTCLLAFAQQEAATDEQAARATVETFWKHLSAQDPAGMKKTMGIPFAAMEITPEGTGGAFAYKTTMEMDRNLERMKSGKVAKWNAILSGMKVTMLGKGAAYATYTCTLPDKPPVSLISVLRKDSKDNGAWKIVFTGVPM